MKLLLDTHVWIWFVMGASELEPRIVKILESKDTRRYLSPLSIWEAMLLGEKGRLQLSPTPHLWVRKAIKAAGVEELPLTWESAALSRELQIEHSDPADRFIAASALAHDLTLVTYDERLQRVPGLRCLPPR